MRFSSSVVSPVLPFPFHLAPFTSAVIQDRIRRSFLSCRIKLASRHSGALLDILLFEVSSHA
jgi:hypothetical protein